MQRNLHRRTVVATLRVKMDGSHYRQSTGWEIFISVANVFKLEQNRTAFSEEHFS